MTEVEYLEHEVEFLASEVARLQALAAQSYQPDRCLWARNGNEACTMPLAHQPHIDLLEEIKWAEEELSSIDDATAQVVAKSFKAVIEKIKVEK